MISLSRMLFLLLFVFFLLFVSLILCSLGVVLVFLLVELGSICLSKACLNFIILSLLFFTRVELSKLINFLSAFSTALRNPDFILILLTILPLNTVFVSLLLVRSFTARDPSSNMKNTNAFLA